MFVCIAKRRVSYAGQMRKNRQKEKKMYNVKAEMIWIACGGPL